MESGRRRDQGLKDLEINEHDVAVVIGKPVLTCRDSNDARRANIGLSIIGFDLELIRAVGSSRHFPGAGIGTCGH